MAAAALVSRLNRLMSSMFSRGYLDDYFKQLQMLQDGSPGLVTEVVTLFCENGEWIIGELTKLLEQSVVDFNKVDTYVHQFMGSSASVGAEKVKNSAAQLCQFSLERSTDGCIRTLDIVKDEFYDTRDKFETMLQLQQQILDLQNPKQ